MTTSPATETATFERLTIVLPAFEEAERIGPALDELFEYLDSPAAAASLPPAVDVLVVDDGSTDGTAAIVAARPEATAVTKAGPAPESMTGAPRLAVLTVPHAGKGAAVQAGMLAAAGDAIVFADADMATPPDQLPLLVASLTSVDVALGSRIQRDGSDRRASQPPYRRFLGRAFHALAAAWVTGSVPDTQCGFKGFRRAAAHDLFARQRVRSIVFDAELIHLARRRGYTLAVVPVEWADRRGSRMRPRLSLAIRVAWDLFRIPLLHRGVGRGR